MEAREKKPATMKDVEAIEALFKQHPTYRRAAIDMTRGRWKQAGSGARKGLFELAKTYQAESDGDLVQTALNVLFMHKPEKHELYELAKGRDGSDVHTSWGALRAWMKAHWPGQRRLKAETIGDLLYMGVERAMAQDGADHQLLRELLDDVIQEPPARRARLLNRSMTAWTIVATSGQHRGHIGETLTLLMEAGADVNCVREDGETPLTWVCGQVESGVGAVDRANMLNNSVEAVGALLEYGARWEVVETGGMNAYLKDFIETHPKVRRDKLRAGLEGGARTTTADPPRTPKF